MATSKPNRPIRLFAFGSGWGIPFGTAAPFPLKLATWLRMTELEHELVVENNPGKGPKKKSPWIEDGEVRMGDSELIIRYLEREIWRRPRCAPLCGRSRPVARLAPPVRRALPPGFRAPALLWPRRRRAPRRSSSATMPSVARAIAPPLMRSQFRKQLYARGLGRHDEKDIIAMGQADLDAASVFLGDRPYFLGDEPSGTRRLRVRLSRRDDLREGRQSALPARRVATEPRGIHRADAGSLLPRDATVTHAL